MATTDYFGWPRPTLTDPADVEVIGQALDAIDAELPLIQWGTTTITTTNSHVGNTDVTFPRPYAVPPVVVIGGPNDTNFIVGAHQSLHTPTTGRINIRQRENTPGDYSVIVSWCAVGRPA